MKKDTGTYAPIKRVSLTHTHKVTNSLDGRNGPWVRFCSNKQAAAIRQSLAR